MLAYGQRRDGVAESITEVGILGAAAVTGPKIGMNSELRKVRQPPECFVGSVRLAGGQSAKSIEVYRSRSLRRQVRIQENFMAQFVLGVVRNVLVHVLVKLLYVFGVVGFPPVTCEG